MSLINQMLQDLEKRRPGGETATLSSAQVIAVPNKRRRSPFFWPAMLLLVPAAGALAWLLLQAQSPKKALVTQPTKQEVADTTASNPVPTDATALETQAVSPQDLQAQAPSSLPEEAAFEPVLKSSTELAMAPKLAYVPATPKSFAGLATTAASNAPTSHNPAPSAQAAGSSADNASQNPIAAAPREPAPSSQVRVKEKASLPSANIAKQVRESTPQQQAEGEYRKALALMQQGRVTEAINGLTQALQWDARHAAARQTLIGLLVEAKRYGEAERRLQESLALEPSQPELAMTLARLQVERGDVRAGLATLERTLPYAAERPDYQAFMAALLQRENRHREAIEHYLLATRKAPQSGVWLMGLGISLQSENRFQEARQAFSQAKATNSLSPELEAFVEQRLKQLGQ